MNLISAAIPFAIVKGFRLFKKLRMLGLSFGNALRAALNIRTPTRLFRSRFDLLPSGALRNGCVAVDVGANNGNWTEDLLSLVSVKRVLAIEPDPRISSGLLSKFERSSCVTVLATAIGSTQGTLPFYQMEDPSMNSFLAPTPEALSQYGRAAFENSVVKISVEPLDSLTESLDLIDLLKIDVQGFESEVIKGASATLKRTKYLFLEVNFFSHYYGELTFAELSATLMNHGFVLCNLSPPCQGDDGRALWADALFMKIRNQNVAPAQGSFA